jgi:hypothetical protein
MRSSVDARDGRPVLVREGVGAASEANILLAIAGPGVPEVLEAGDERVVLPWAAALPVPHAAADLAILAAAVARAHDAGVVHGPFLAEQVRSGPLLLGWGEAPDGWTAADDVASFGDLAALSGHDAVAARATVADVDARPAMQAVAASLVPSPRPLRPPPRRPMPRRWPRVLVAVPTALVLGLAAALVLHTPRSAASRLPSATSQPTTTSTTSTTIPSVGPSDGVVEFSGHRWAAGLAGDVVVLGDWSCSGAPTPAVLRPATGQVWRFERWPEGAEPVASRAVGVVPDGRRLAVRRVDGCDQLLAVDRRGQSTVVG